MDDQHQCDNPACSKYVAIRLDVNGGLWACLCNQCWHGGHAIVLGTKVHFRYTRVGLDSGHTCSAKRCSNTGVHKLVVNGETYYICMGHYQNEVPIVMETEDEFTIVWVP